MNSPKSKPMRRKLRGFTLIEIMIVSAITGIIVAIAVPSWFRQRHLSQQRSCQENLFKMDQAKEQYAMENNLSTGVAVEEEDLYYENATGYLKTRPRCPAEGDYDYTAIGTDSTCTIDEPFDHNAKPTFQASS